MKVLNRAGALIDVSYNAISERLLRLCDEQMRAQIDIDRVVIQTIGGIYDGITTAELDDLSSRICASLQSVHFLYDVLAARILSSNLAKGIRGRLEHDQLPDGATRKRLAATFSGKTAYVASHADSTLDPGYVAFVAANAGALDALVDYSADGRLSYFSLRTLEKSYLMRIDGLVVESPQDMWMRVAVAVARPRAEEDRTDADAMADVARVYGAMAAGDYTHATPTLFNAGMRVQQCSSCFVADTEVVTVNAGIKKIQDVEIGDLVVTHLGNVKPVTQLHRNPLGDRRLRRIQVAGARTSRVGRAAEVVATEDHRFWASPEGDEAARWIRADALIPGWHRVVSSDPACPGEVLSNVVDDGLGLGPDSVVYTLGVEDDHSYPVGALGLFAENCYLLGTDDSLEGIFKTLGDCAQISKWAGGIGLHVTNVRAKGSRIASTNGTSDGIIPMLKVYNETARYCNQSGRRKGSIAVYLEPWHADVWEFVELRRNTGAETERARDLFLALWVPDEFMRRLEADDDWFLMSPDVCPGLIDAFDGRPTGRLSGDGDPRAFSDLYNKYVAEGKFVKKVRARALWQHVLACQLETGVPYVMFKDSVNRKCNQSNVGTVRSSNLCVAPETHVLTSSGFHPIAELVDKEVKVWNGTVFSDTVVRKTGVDQPLLKVAFSNGEELECTPYHKFYVQEPGDMRKAPVIVVEAKDLQDGDMIAKFSMPVVPDAELLSGFKYPYTHGLFCAEGTYAQDKPILQLYGEKKLLVEHLDRVEGSSVHYHDKSDCSVMRLPLDVATKFVVPVNHVLSEKLRWLEGVVDGDGCLLKTPFGDADRHSMTIQVSSVDVLFLLDVKRMLNTMGTDPKIALASKGGMRTMPDGRGGSGEFETQACYRLMINSVDLAKLHTMGFSPKRISLEGMGTPQRDARRFVVVTDVSDLGRRDDTYCFTEPLEGKGVFNGILLGNCAEVTEVSDASSYAVCNLASIAVNRFVLPPPPADPTADGSAAASFLDRLDWPRLHEAAKQLTRNLNRVIDMNSYPTPEARASNLSMRPIGVGLQGLGDLYCELHLPYDDPRAVALDAAVTEAIYHGCVEASVELAERDGPYSRFAGSPASEGKLQFDLWTAAPAATVGDVKATSDVADGRGGAPPAAPLLSGLPRSGRWDWDALKARVVRSGMRNSLLTALMPTATTSQILGNCESFEPFQANVFKRSTMAGEFVVVNRHLMRDMMALGLWTEDLRRQLLARDGSVQQLPQVPDELKAVYRTVWEVPQRSVIDHAAARGPYVDQSQSMNLYMAAPSFQKLSSALVHAWKSGLKTGVYYLRSMAAVEAIKYGLLPAGQPTSASTSVAGGHGRGKAAAGGSPAAKAGKAPKGAAAKAAAAAAAAAEAKGDGEAEAPVLVCRRDDPACEMCSA